ncbi:MAG: hypothetical protein DMG88_14075 [Acidobacteria bacterium]|nr:MAG: hypothetical protein DMG88_14075 [Acidobacteriota bacterium]
MFYPQFPQDRPEQNVEHTKRRTHGSTRERPKSCSPQDRKVVHSQKEMALARVRREGEALQILVPLLDDPMERLPGLISSPELPVNSDAQSLAEFEVYYPFVKHLHLAGGGAKEG